MVLAATVALDEARQAWLLLYSGGTGLPRSFQCCVPPPRAPLGSPLSSPSVSTWDTGSRLVRRLLLFGGSLATPGGKPTE